MNPFAEMEDGEDVNMSCNLKTLNFGIDHACR